MYYTTEEGTSDKVYDYVDKDWLKDYLDSNDFSSSFEYNCCRNCPNNPKYNKFASGVCFCTLPYMESPIY